jgi:hypothetical protein
LHALPTVANDEASHAINGEFPERISQRFAEFAAEIS